MLAPDPGRMAVHMAGERFLAVVDDLDGTIGVQGEHRSVHLHGEVLAAAEGTAHTTEVDPDLLQRQAEARRDLCAVDVQPLRRNVDVDAALAVRHGEARLGPEERLILDADVVDPAHRHVARCFGVTVPDSDVAHDIRARILEVAVTTGRLLGVQVGQLGRPLHVGDRLEQLVLDADALGGPPSLLGVLGCDESDRLAEVEDSIDGEHRLILKLEPVVLRARDIGMGEHRVHARHRDGGRDVELGDPRVRMGTAQRVAPEHPRHDQVAGVDELALHLRRSIEPRDELPDLADPKRARGLGHSPTAMRTASKIFA